MTKEDKEKYFSQSQEEQRRHAQQNPHWSYSDNYVSTHLQHVSINNKSLWNTANTSFLFILLCVGPKDQEEKTCSLQW